MPQVIADYWGKARPQHPGPTFHPLAWHSLDVAAVMAVLLEEWPWAAERLASAAGLPPPQAARLAVAATALHDLGKFADAFQAKAEPWTGRASWGARPIPASFDHGAFGELLWQSAPSRRAFDFDTGDRFTAWLRAAFGHHGSPTNADGMIMGDVIQPSAVTDAHAFIADILALIDPPLTGAMEDEDLSETWLIAGLTVIADWVGSHPAWFPYREPHGDLAAYWRDIALPNARRAVRAAGLAAAAPAASLSLQDLTGRADAPTPLQRWAAEAPLPPGPVIAVIEDLTGAGKTEAALLLAHRMMAAGKARGLYWALPTQATANMLHDRLKPTAERRGYRALFAADAEPSLALAHGGVDIADGFQTTIIKPRDPAAPDAADAEPDAAGVPTASAQCAGWLADERRKSLLAHVGVGTVDQALMAALPRRFAQLRQAALAGHALVIDEVHGYDPYVARTLEALLEGHARLGGSAILVSATLSTAAKQRFIDAFRRGAGHPPAALADRAFPMATLAGADGARAEAQPAQRGTRRDLPVRLLNDADAAAAHALAHARAGRCVAWIRNTVDDARAAYALLRDRAPDLPLTLFHARFAACDRQRIEGGVLADLGPASTPAARAPGGIGRVVVATQVIEQSLDLDFDAMLTDLAPLELLIQRAGRLHRHRRGARPAPELAVLAPPPPFDAGWFARLSRDGAGVYPNHAALWAALRLLADRGLPLLGSDPRSLIEAVEARVERGDVPSALLASRHEHDGRTAAERAAAQLVALETWKPFDQAGPWRRDDEAPTRLGQETRLLRLARWEGGSLTPWAGGDGWRAWRRSELPLAIHRADAVAPGPWDAAIAAARTGWPRRLDDCLLVPLTPDASGGWTATLLKAAAPRRCTYHPDTGLALH